MYESYYKFKANPFQLSPNPELFYGSRGHNRALAYLQYGQSQEEGFIVVTGQVGTGKTMLVHALFHKLDNNNLVSARLVTTQLDEDQILMMVAESFGLDSDGLGKAQILSKLIDFFVAKRQQGKRALLVVDEVQNLPKKSLEELRMLSNIQNSGKPLLQIFLLGQQEFVNTLYSPDMEQLLQRVTASFHLKPLGEDEVKNYIEYRLSRVGWRGNPVFSSDAYQVIFEFTKGVPRRINHLCTRILLYGYLEELHKFDKSTIQAVIKELDEDVPVVTNSGREARGNPLEQRMLLLEKRIAQLEDDNRLERERTRKVLTMLANKVKA